MRTTEGQEFRGCVSTGQRVDRNHALSHRARNGRVASAVSSWGVRMENRLPSFLRATVHIFQLLLSQGLRSPSIREIRQEIRSLLWRIGRICEATPFVCYGRVGSLQQRHENERTLACMKDTQETTLFLPWATMMDRQVFVEGWKRGAEWALREGCNSHLDNSQKNHFPSNTPCTAAQIIGSESTPEDSKHGL